MPSNNELEYNEIEIYKQVLTNIGHDVDKIMSFKELKSYINTISEDKKIKVQWEKELVNLTSQALNSYTKRNSSSEIGEFIKALRSNKNLGDYKELAQFVRAILENKENANLGALLKECMGSYTISEIAREGSFRRATLSDYLNGKNSMRVKTYEEVLASIQLLDNKTTKPQNTSVTIQPKLKQSNNTMKVITVGNFKGGTGKSTSAMNIASALVQLGNKVLAIDLDAQTNLTDLMGFAPEEIEEKDCISNAMLNGTEMSLYEVGDTGRLFLCPSYNLSMIGLDGELANIFVNAESRLKKLLSSEQIESQNFDYVVIDLPPALNRVTFNGFVAADRIVVPVIPDYLSVIGMQRLYEKLAEYDLSVTDILFTKVEDHLVLSKQMMEEIRNSFGSIVCDATIPKNVSLAEQGIEGISIFKYAPNSKGANSYMKFVKELIERMN